MPAASNTALVVRVAGGQSPKLSKETIPIPSPAAHQVLVRLSHVAQNPTDGNHPLSLCRGEIVTVVDKSLTPLPVQSFDNNAFGDGVVLGCDFVGEVVELGSREVKYVGAYSQYCLADERISFKVPQSISPAHASTVPLAAATAWLALFSNDCLGLDRSKAKETSILVWVAALASYLGFEVVTTCSPKHAELVRAYGAQHVFDCKDEEVVTKIQNAVPNLAHTFDTIGNRTSSSTASEALRGGVGKLCTVRPGKAHTENITAGTVVTDVLVWTAFLKDHSYGDIKWPASEHDHELSSELFEKLPRWLEKSIVKPSDPKVLHGLDSVPDGFQEHRDGKISAYKIVYEI